MFHLRPGCLSAGNEMSTVHSLCSESGSSAGRVLPKDQCWGLVTKGNSVKRPKVLALGYVIRSQERQEDWFSSQCLSSARAGVAGTCWCGFGSWLTSGLFAQWVPEAYTGHCRYTSSFACLVIYHWEQRKLREKQFKNFKSIDSFPCLPLHDSRAHCFLLGPVGNNPLQLTINAPGKNLTHTTGEELADGLSLSFEEVKDMAAAVVTRC